VARDERVLDLFFLEDTTQPTDEGQVKFYNGDLIAMLGGQIKSLTMGLANFDDIILDDEGRIVYIGDGEFVLRG
jgi:hypothetical protein